MSARRARVAPNGRPLIGVTGPERGGLAAWLMTRLALWRAGARAVRITPERPWDDPERLDGLVLGGGADVASGPGPAQPPSDSPRRAPLWRRAVGVLLAPVLFLLRLVLSTFTQRDAKEDHRRDELEFHLLAYARQQGLPVLGICRGAQLMNLSEGGSLVRNVGSFYEERAELYTALPRRDVEIQGGSRLARALGVERARVNSLHQHAVDRPGRQLRIVARELDGVNQAIEHTTRQFWIGVQWHPEYLPQLAVQQRLFQELTRHAGQQHELRPARRRQAAPPLASADESRARRRSCSA